MVAHLCRGDSILKPLSWYKDLARKSNRVQEGFFLIEGRRAIDQIARSSPGSIAEILMPEGSRSALPLTCPVRQVPARSFSALCRTQTPQDILACVKIPDHTYDDQLPKNPGTHILLLEHLQDPGNVGALVRTAAAFDFSGIIVSESSADPFGPKAVQASAGTLLSLWIRCTPGYLSLVRTLREHDFSLIATAPEGGQQKKIAGDKLIIAFGNEGNGLTGDVLDIADERMSIPINRHKAESLNVAASGAICIYLLANRRYNKKMEHGLRGCFDAAQHR